jgi:hypothetical protein
LTGASVAFVLMEKETSSRAGGFEPAGDGMDNAWNATVAGPGNSATVMK